MKRPSLARPIALAALLLAAGCAETASPPDDASDAAASSTDAATDAARACPARPALAAPAACSGLTELVSPANLIAGSGSGVTAYALRAIAAGADRAHPACVVEPWQDGGEALVRFTAPTGGRWRLTARGEHLGALRAARGCGTDGACADFQPYHGAHVTAEVAVDVQAQRGESFSVLVDGCPAGASCTYDLRAERVGALACAFVGGDAAPCASSQVCAIDACDAERFACAPLAPTRLASARVVADRATGRGYVVGRLAPVATGSLRRETPALMVHWQRADGAPHPAPDYVGVVRADDDAFTFGPTEVPADAARARVWLYGGSRPMEAQIADGLDVAVEGWTRGAVGVRCGAALFERCARGLRCEAGACAPSTALRITSLRAWRDVAAPSLRLQLAGEGLGEIVTQAALELVSASGATLARVPAQSLYSRHEQPSQVPFTATLTLERNGALASLAAAARVRVRVVDTTSRTSEPFEATLEDAAVASLGDACADFASRCAAGLACADEGTASARCEPVAAPRPCGLSASAAVWAPPTSGAYMIEGVSRGFGGSASCQASRSASQASAEFVAPTAGRYVFEGRGLSVIEVVHTCEAPTPTPVCVRAPAARRIEATLAAGEHVALTVLGEAHEAPWSVTVQVP